MNPQKVLWACHAFIVNKHSEIMREKPKLVVFLAKVLQPVRYSLPNEASLLQRIPECTIFSKFDLKSGFYQIGIEVKSKYKNAFVVPHGQYQWNVLPFGINNAPL